jgi:hypothetical protein
VIFERVEGGLRLTIDDHSREVIVQLLGELRNQIDVAKNGAPDAVAPHMKRLFPSAYHDDETMNEEYRRLTHDDLAGTHLATIDDAMSLLSPGRVFDTDALSGFVRAINAMRLVLGTILDVSEDDAEDIDDDDPAAPQRHLYDYLGWLLHSSIDQMSR